MRSTARCVALFVSTVSIQFEGVALAHPGVSCPTTMYQVAATQGTQGGNHVGVRSLQYFGQQDSGTPYCMRVSNLAVVSTSNGYLEWGWLLGWSLDHADGNPCDDYPSSQYYDTPLLFAQWKRNNGPVHCARIATVTGGQNYTVTIKNGDTDHVWKYLFEGNEKGSVTLDVNRGNIETNTERHSNGDSAYADHDNLAFQVAGSTVSNPSSELIQANDPGDDPDWHCRKLSEDHHSVRQLDRTCPSG